MSTLPKLPNFFISSLNQTLNVGGNDTSIALSTIYTLDGQVVTTADFATFGRGVITINPITLASVEFSSFTGITPGTAPEGTLTGVLRGLSFKDNTQIAANQKFNVVGTPVLISFGTHNIIDIMTVVNDNYDTLLALINSAVLAGGVPASTTVMGISRLSDSPNVTLGTCTITIASPAVITLASHGLTSNDIVQFTTSGSLPTGIISGDSYYVLSTGLTTNTFEISLTPGGTAINTSGSQSGTHTLIKVTPIAVGTNNANLLSAVQKAAIAGTSGTPSSTNKFETENDTSNAATITAVTISFTASTKTITDSGNGFVTANFRTGDSIIVTGTSSNNGTYTIFSVTAGSIVVVESLVNESAGGTFTITTTTINKLVRYSSSSQVKVPITPVASNDSTSKDYVDSTAPIWKKISTVSISQAVLNTATTKIVEFTGLTGNTDDEYMAEFEISTPGADNSCLFYLRLNDDATSSHYGFNVTPNSATTGSNTSPASYPLNSGASQVSITCFGTFKIKASRTIAGTQRAITSCVFSGNGVANIGNSQITGGWSDTTNQITSIQIYMTNGVGSTVTCSGSITLSKINR